MFRVKGKGGRDRLACRLMSRHFEYSGARRSAFGYCFGQSCSIRERIWNTLPLKVSEHHFQFRKTEMRATHYPHIASAYGGYLITS